jgi:hypothetical protein
VLTGVDSGRPAEEALEDAIWKACAEWASFQPIPGAAKEHVEQVLGMDSCTFCFEDQFQIGSEYYLRSSPERNRRMEKFAEGCARTNFEFNPSDISQERIGRYATNAASSGRYQIADGPDFRKLERESAPVVVPPAPQSTLGASPEPDSGSLTPSRGGLFQFGRRVFGGQERPEEDKAFPPQC